MLIRIATDRNYQVLRAWSALHQTYYLSYDFHVDEGYAYRAFYATVKPT